ncbi:phage tail tape measure protein [Paenibacillus odorifer]|uniref:phage tail tape measure protein n=1 Tax=Paenibacillus odorifer TaxID=189426 RepID=UPI00097A021D|nr:phage tail tape measure protein [Paenibacillus odorifer]OME53974.1 phage tail tape measure protein [Paenibacillus odorifer]
MSSNGSDFNILIGVDMTNAEKDIAKSIETIGNTYKLKLTTIIENEDKIFKDIDKIKKLFSTLGKIDLDFGVEEGSKEINQIKNVLKELSKIDLSDIGETLEQDMKDAKRATDDLTTSFKNLLKVQNKVKPDGEVVDTKKTGSKYKNTTETNSSKKGKTVENVKDIAGLDKYMEQATAKIDSFENVAKDGRSKKAIDNLKTRVKNLPSAMEGSDDTFAKELKSIQEAIVKYDKLEQAIKEKGSAERFQLEKTIDLQNKLAKIQREGLANNGSVANLKNLMDTFANADFSKLDEAKRQFSAIEKQLKVINGQEEKGKFTRKTTKEGENLTKKVQGNIDPDVVGQKSLDALAAQIKQVFNAESITGFEKAVKKVNNLFDEMLDKQKKILAQRKMDAQGEEDTRKMQKQIEATANAQAEQEQEKKVKDWEKQQRVDKFNTKDREISKNKNNMIASGLVDAKDFDEVEQRLRELARLAQNVHVDDLDMDKGLKEVDKMMAKISERYQDLDAKQRKIKASTHDWKKEIDSIKSSGFVKENEFDGIRKNMRNLSADSKTYEQDLKRIQTQIARMNTVSAQRKDRQETRDVTKNSNNAKLNSMKGVVPDNLINDMKSLNNMIDFSSSKKDIALIQDEMRKIVKLENDIKSAGNDEAKIRKAIADHQMNAVKSADKFNDTLAEIVLNSNRQIQSAEKRTEIEEQAKRIQREINELKERGLTLSYDEQRAIQQKISALRQQAQAQRDAERESADRTSATRNLNDKFDSTAYRATRGFDLNSPQARELNDTIRNIRRQVEGLGRLTGEEFRQATRNIEDQMTRLNRRSAELRDADARRRGSMSGQLVNALKKVPIWTAAMSMVYGVMEQIKRGFQSILDIDAAMINLQKVTEASKLELEKFKSTASDMGRDLGVVATDVIKATTEFQKLGYTLEESASLGKNSILYANVGDMSVQDASDNIVSTIKGFGIAVDEQGNNVRGIVDMYNEVGNNFAITSAGLGEALKRSSSVMSEAGNSIQESIGLVTAANGVLQDPARVGNGLKTIAMRLRGVGEEAGELVPALQPIFDRINTQMNLMGENALQVMETDGKTFKSTYEIFEGLVGIWDELSDIERANLVETMGGKHQGVVVSSIISNWKDAKDSAEVASNSAGSAAREFDAYTDGFAYRIGKLKNALEKFWSTLIDSEAVKNLISALTSIIDAMTWAVEEFGASPLLSLLGGLLLFGTSTGLRNSIAGVTSFAGAFQGLGTWIMSAVKMLPRLVPYLAIVVAIGWAVTKVISLMTAENRARKEKLKLLDQEVTKLEETQSKYQDMFDTTEGKNTNLDRYGELQKLGNLRTPEQNNEFNDMTNNIKTKMPELVSYYDEYRNAVLLSVDAIKALRREQEQALLSTKEDQFNLTVKDTDFDDLNEKLEKTREAFKEMESGNGGVALQEAAKTYIETKMQDYDKSADDAKERMQGFRDEMQRIFDELPESQQLNAEGWLRGLQSKSFDSKETDKEILQGVERLRRNAAALRNTYTKQYEETKETLGTGADELNKLIDTAFSINLTKMNIDTNSNEFQFLDNMRLKFLEDVSQFGDDAEEILGNIPALMNDAISNLDDKGMTIDKLIQIDPATSEKTISEINQILKVLDEGNPQDFILIKMLEEYRKKHNEAYNDSKVRKIEPFSIETSVMPKVNGLIDELGSLDSAYRTLADGEELSLSNTMELITKYPELIKHMKKENGVLKISKAGIMEMAKIKERAFKQEMEYEIEKRRQSLATAKQIVADNKKQAESILKVMSVQAIAAKSRIVDTYEGKNSPLKPTSPVVDPANPDYSGMLNSVVNFDTEKWQKSQEYVQAKTDLAAVAASNAAQAEVKKSEDAVKKIEQEIKDMELLMSQDWSSQLGSITGGKDDKEKKEKDKKDIQDGIYIVDQYTKRINNLNRSIEKQQKLQTENATWSQAYQKSLNEEIYLTGLKKKAIDNEIASLQNQIKANSIKKTGLISIDASENENKTARLIAAELQQEIDQAEDRLRELGSESDSVSSQISDLRMKQVSSKIEAYNMNREALTDDIAYQEYAMSLYDDTTQAYRDHANEKLKLTQQQQKYNKEELAFLEKEKASNKNLTKSQIEELNSQIRAKREAIYEMAGTITDIETLIAKSTLDKHLYQFAKESEKYADMISDIEEKIQYDMDEDKDFNKHIDYLKQIIALRKGEQADIERNIKYLEGQLVLYKDNKEMVELINNELDAQNDKLKETSSAVKESNAEIKSVYEKVADQYVDMYKEQLELMQEADEKYYANKIEAEQKNHEKRMKQIEKEMDALQEAYDKQMKMIDRAEGARSHDNDVTKLQKETNELKKQIDMLSMDDSYEAKAKKAELVKQLSEKELELSEIEHSREVELRKENLEDDLESEKEKLENRKEKYEEDLDNLVDSLEEEAKKKQEAWEAELNNEKKFAEMRKEVLAGNFEEMLKNIESWSDSVSGRMGDLGKEITENFTWKIQEALKAIKELNDSKVGSFDKVTSGVTANNQDAGVKPTVEIPKNNELTEADKETDTITKMKANSISWNNSKDDPKEQERLHQANVSLAKSIGAVYKNGTWYKKDGKTKLYGFKTGGYTGDWEGDDGKLAVLHKKELVLNEDQTRNILDTAKIVEKFKSIFPSMNTMSSIPKPKETSVVAEGNTENNEYNIEVNINGNADKKVAETVADQIINKIKRTKGGRF